MFARKQPASPTIDTAPSPADRRITGKGLEKREALLADALDRFHIVGKKDLFPSQPEPGLP